MTISWKLAVLVRRPVLLLPRRSLTLHALQRHRALPLQSKLKINHYLQTSALRAALFHFKLHDIGEGITEVEIIKWHVKPGDRIEEFDSLCEVQSDKSVVEITSPHTGVISALSAEPGQTVQVGQTLCAIKLEDASGTMEEGAEDEQNRLTGGNESNPRPGDSAFEVKHGIEGVISQENAAVAEAEDLSESLEKLAEKNEQRTLNETATPPSSHASDDTRVRFVGEASVLPDPPREVRRVPQTVVARRIESESSAKRKVKASPSVRTLAARLGIDLSLIVGTGDEGRVTKEDVERATPTVAQNIAFAGNASRGDETERIEMGRTRKAMFRAMSGMAAVPHFGYTHSLDLSHILPYMQAANDIDSSAGPSYTASDIPANLVHTPYPTEASKISLLAFLVKALLLALEEHPIMRARLREHDNERWLDVSRDASIGIAVSDPTRGLLTPVLPTIGPQATLASINEHLKALRSNPVRPGPTPHVTLSSVGPLGESRGAMPVLPPGGGLAIAAVGRAAWEVEWVARNKLAGTNLWSLNASQVERAGTRAVLRCPVGWSGDHRVLEGAELIAFTESWKRYVEEPKYWLNL